MSESWKSSLKSFLTKSVFCGGTDNLTDDVDFSFSTKCLCKLDSNGIKCDTNSCMNRGTLLECDPIQCGNGCVNNRISKELYKDLQVLETPPKGHGLFTKVDLKEGDILDEYVGEVIDSKELNKRLTNDKGKQHFQQSESWRWFGIPANGSFNHENNTMNRAPDDKRPIGSMPQATNNKGDKYILVGTQ